MIALLLLALSAQADPGRVVAVGTAGAGQGYGLSLHGTLDYGLTRRLALTGELGHTPGEVDLRLGGGLLWTPVDSQWWRVGLAALPEVRTPLDHLAPGLGARVGLRANYLLFWGLCLGARVDWTLPGSGWPEVGLGLGVRL